MDLIDAASYHGLVLNAEGKSPKTQELYLIYEKRFLAYLEQANIAPTLDALNPLNVRRAQQWAAEHGTGRRDGVVAVKSLVHTLKTWSSFLTREEVFELDPLARVRRVKVREMDPQPFSRGEVQALLEATSQCQMPSRERALLLLLLDTGIRITEAMTLTTDALSIEKRNLTVIGKGHRDRTVPVGDIQAQDGGPTIRALRRWLVDRELLLRRKKTNPSTVFVSHHGFSIGRDAGASIFHRLGDLAGVSDSHPHKCRATMASVYLTLFPGDEHGLRRILGHVSQRVMDRYVRLAETTVAQRAGRGSPVSQWLGTHRNLRAV